MARIWIVLIDILVYLLLFISFLFLYLNPTSYIHLTKMIYQKKTHCQKSMKVLDKLPLEEEFNTSRIVEKLEGVTEQCSTKEYSIDKNVYLESTLKERLDALSVKMGDFVFIRIFKEESILEVWIQSHKTYVHLKDYIICASSGHLGPKLKEGDKQSPEGFYTVRKHQLNPHSRFHLSFNLGYPNRYDRAYGRTGSFLMVHGNCVSVGCYAMTDEKIEEIYALVKSALKHGQNHVDVHAFPFRMTKENMNLYEGNRWYDFWINLKEGYDYFESERLPPKIKVEAKRYEIYES